MSTEKKPLGQSDPEPPEPPKTCNETGYPCNCEARVRGYWCWGSFPKEKRRDV